MRPPRWCCAALVAVATPAFHADGAEPDLGHGAADTARGSPYVSAVVPGPDASVYVALVQPPDCAGDAASAWSGNLKKFRLAAGGSGHPELVGVERGALPAIGGDGRIRDDVLSAWTDADQAPELAAGDINGDGTVEPRVLNPEAPANPPGVHSGRDGGHVRRGGAGQKIPGFRSFQHGPGDANGPGRRQVFYLGRDTGQLAPLEVTDAVADELGPLLRPQGYSAQMPHDPRHPAFTQRHHARRLLRYIRGQDVNDEDQGITAEHAVDLETRLEFSDPEYTEARPWLMGDSQNGRPLVVAYTRNPPATFIAVAGNDGLLRLIRDTTDDGVDDGEEVWAFIPDEALAVQERLQSGRHARDGEYPRPYGFDGGPAAFIIDRDGNGQVDGGDKVYLVAGLRRLGSAYYALDISDPYRPRFLWKVSRAGRLAAGTRTPADAGDYAELGLAFSTPRAARIPDRQDAAGKVVATRLGLVLGGGYDGGPPLGGVRPGKDHRGPGTDDRVGNALFVLEAATGRLVWKAVRGATAGPGSDPRVYTHPHLTDGIPSPPTVVDTDGDGVHDRIVVGDTGGNLWRADLGASPRPVAGEPPDVRQHWLLVRLACLGRHGGPGCSVAAARSEDRRFFHAPDLVQVLDGGQRLDVVIAGSGDPENLLDHSGGADARTGPFVQNRVYAVRDPHPAVGAATALEISSAGLADVTLPCADGDCRIAGAGWYFDLVQAAPDGTPGEKALSPPVTVAHTVYFTTYIPPARDRACAPGSGALYGVQLGNGAPALEPVAGTSMTHNQRHQALASAGPPPAVVFLDSRALGSPATAGHPPCAGALLAGTATRPVRACTRFRTFWSRQD